MNNLEFWSVVLVLAALTTGCGNGPVTTPPSQEATLAAGEVITNSIGMKLVGIPAGEFMMGSPDSASYALGSEKPQHRVRITKSFYLGVYEVTIEEYRRVTGSSWAISSTRRAPMHPWRT